MYKIGKSKLKKIANMSFCQNFDTKIIKYLTVNIIQQLSTIKKKKKTTVKFPHDLILSYQPRVTVTSSFVCKVIRDIIDI